MEFAPAVVMPVVVRTAREPKTAVELVVGGVGLSVAVPRTVEVVLSVQVTVPVGFRVPGPAPDSPVIVKVSWTLLALAILEELVVSAPASGVGVMVTVTGVALAAPKLESPEYEAPST